jgi:beta-glucosidase
MFREGFTWGAASSAYQIEGGATAHGRGPSVWDTFCADPGKVYRNQTGAVACDHYHRLAEDVAIMKRMGLHAYRFSTSWSRIMPAGKGAVNGAGLAFYDRLVDELLAAKIEPWLTLFHWDFPQALQLEGGWLNPDSAKWFAEYAEVVTRRLSDRVRHWMTINEPQVYIGLGYRDGTHAPGMKLPTAQWLQAGHNTLIAHGLGVQAIRASAVKKPTVGWAIVNRVEFPATDSPADIEAARRSTLSVTAKDTWSNTWWADPAILGHYPEDGLKLFGADAPKFTASEMATICQPLDFYGVNIYSGEPVKAGPDGNPVAVPWADGNPLTTFRWNIAPKSLQWGPRFLYERYKLPIVVTENGMANADWVHSDGEVHDPQRIDFTRNYLLELAKASTAGTDIRGYFHWSILDNFEWAEGYRERFGLVHVDFATGKRTLKDSGKWYREVIATNGRNLLQTSGGEAMKPAASLEHGPLKAEILQ